MIRPRRLLATAGFFLGAAAGLVMGTILGASHPATAEMISPERPSIPLAIDQNIFNGGAKGLVPPTEVILSTKLGNSAWTGFFGAADTDSVVRFVNDPVTMPTVRVGDVLTMSSANGAAEYQALDARRQPASVAVVPVVSFDPDRRHGTVTGFASLRIDKIRSCGSPKYVDTTLVGLVPTTLIP